jgi:hypothetical protein
MPKVFDIEVKDVNSELVAAIENHAKNNIELTLNGVFDFMKKREDFTPQFKVFKEYFVLCWAGQRKEVKDEVFFSRVDIELINEQKRLFYSALDEVSIFHSDEEFRIVEYVKLGLHNTYKYYKLEETTINFEDSAKYNISTELIFEPPQFDKKVLHHIYNANNTLLIRLKKRLSLTETEKQDLLNLPATYLICYLNGFDKALNKLLSAKPLLKDYSDNLSTSYKETIRILRKVKYN